MLYEPFWFETRKRGLWRPRPTDGKQAEVGGLIGYANAYLTSCENTGTVTCTPDGGFAGGLIGSHGANTNVPVVVHKGCIVNCNVEGAATKGSVLGKFRYVPSDSFKLTSVAFGTDDAPFTISGGAAALYSEKVMDHFRNPRNVGVIEDADGVGEVGNAKCGDIMKMYLKIDNDTVTDVKFETFGCGSAIASSSMATELIKGKPLSEVKQLTNKAVAEALDGLPAYKMHCSVLAEEAIQSALEDYYKKHPEKQA